MCAYIPLRHSTNSIKCFDKKGKTTALYTDAPTQYELWISVLQVDFVNLIKFIFSLKCFQKFVSVIYSSL